MVGGRAGALLADDGGDADSGGGGKSVFLADLNSVMQKRALKRAPTHKLAMKRPTPPRPPRYGHRRRDQAAVDW